MSTKNIKSSKSAKNTVPASKPRTAKSRKPAASPDAEETGLVRITDLTGVAWVYLPEPLRGLIGEAAYQMQVAALECSTVTVIGRHPGDVVFVHLPVMVANAQPPATSARQVPPATAPKEPKL